MILSRTVLYFEPTALLLTSLLLDANRRVLIVSSKLDKAGESVAIILAIEFPPKEFDNNRVNNESLFIQCRRAEHTGRKSSSPCLLIDRWFFLRPSDSCWWLWLLPIGLLELLFCPLSRSQRDPQGRIDLLLSCCIQFIYYWFPWRPSYPWNWHREWRLHDFCYCPNSSSEQSKNILHSSW